MISAWVINLSITITAGTLDHVFRKKNGPQSLFGSKLVTYVMSGYVLMATAAMIFLYTWISYLVLIRHQKFDRSANNGENISKVKLFTKAIRRERATLTICILVKISFVSCNLPVAVRFLVGANEGNAEVFLVLANSSLNPLIYFFKGYLEKEYANRKAAINSNSGQGVELKSPNLIRKQTFETELDAYEKKDGKLENGDYRRRGGDSGELRTGGCNEIELEDLGEQDRDKLTQDKKNSSKVEFETENMGVQRQDSPQSSESSVVLGGDKKEPDQKSFKFQNKWLLENDNLESTLSSFLLDGEENKIPENSGQSQTDREVISNYDENVEEGFIEENVTENASKENERLRIPVQEIGIANETVDIDEVDSMRTLVVAYL